MVNHWFNIIQEYCFPPTCILCGHSGEKGLDLCPYCRRRLPENRRSCSRCAEIFQAEVRDADWCGHCLAREPAYDKTYAPFIYRAEISHLITSLKFTGGLANARLLGRLLAAYLKNHAELPEAILPVPLHPVRYRQRGFNQSVEIARTVAGELGLPLDTGTVVRGRDTPHQTGLSAKHRRKNMKNAFSVVKPISAVHVAVLDDVMTTGATVDELAAQLKKAGVHRVDVWVCARA